MSRGIAALEKPDQGKVHEWLRLERLARQCAPAPRRSVPWPVLIAVMHVLTFLAGLACGRWLL